MDASAISRRRFATAVAAASLVGAGWAVALARSVVPSMPNAAVIGDDESMLTLIEAGGARCLLLIGPPHQPLIDTLPSVMTMFRKRIDIVIAEHDVLAKLGSQIASSWGVRRFVSIQASRAEPSLAHPTEVVLTPTTIRLGENVTIEVTPDTRAMIGDVSEGPTLYWSATCTRGTSTITFGPTADSLRLTAPVAPTLLICPSWPDTETLDFLRPVSVAVNSSNMEVDDVSVPLTRVFPRDVARFALHTDRIEMPAWTQNSGQSSLLRSPDSD